MASIRKRCKRRIAWIKFYRVQIATIDSYPGGSGVTSLLRFRHSPVKWQYRPLTGGDLFGKWAELFPKKLPTVKMIHEIITPCGPYDPGKLLVGTQVRDADWIIGVDPGVHEGDHAVACHIVKGRNSEGVEEYTMKEFVDFGQTPVKLNDSVKGTP